MNKTEDIKSILHSWSDELLGEVEEHTKAEFARMSDDAEGFAYFYQLLFKRRLPKHAMEEWIKPFYAATAAGRGMLIEAFRGSAKTTTLTTALTAFKIGHYPHSSNLLIQVSDEVAKQNAHNIADLIMHNPGWKQVFPHVVPDAAAGWSKDGYQVKRNDMNYAEWRRLCASTKGKDVTLVG